MPDPAEATAALPLCDGAELEEAGLAHVWNVRLWGAPAHAFALRFEGRVVAYLNRCAHVPVEMDWQPGRFLDLDHRYILCQVHGAVYEPGDGRCIAGPCRGERLMTVDVIERHGHVYWYPSRDIRPAPPVPRNPPP